MPLTTKKQRFADAVMSGESKMNAAISAGYSNATASQAATRLSKDGDVIAYIARVELKNSTTEIAQPVPEKPKTEADESVAEKGDPKDFLLLVMSDPIEEMRVRIDAAKALLPFMHIKLGEGGKKDKKLSDAKDAGAGKFAPTSAPKLVHSR